MGRFFVQEGLYQTVLTLNSLEPATETSDSTQNQEVFRILMVLFFFKKRTSYEGQSVKTNRFNVVGFTTGCSSSSCSDISMLCK